MSSSSKILWLNFSACTYIISHFIFLNICLKTLLGGVTWIPRWEGWAGVKWWTLLEDRPPPELREFSHSLMLQNQNICGDCLLHTPRNLLTWGVDHGGKQGRNLPKSTWPAALSNTLCWQKCWYTLSPSRKCYSNDLASRELLQFTWQSFA